MTTTSRSRSRSDDPVPVRPARANPVVPRRTNVLPITPWVPVEWDEAEAAAFKALWNGSAAPYQQTLVVEWLIYATRHATPPVVPDGTGVSHDALMHIVGAQFVMKQILDMVNYRPKANGSLADTEQGA